MHDKENTSLLHCCKLQFEDQTKQKPELVYQWFSIGEILEKTDIIQSDLEFIKHFYQNRDKNYLKLDCYRNEEGEYYWK